MARVCLRCNSAYCSRATCDGSFKDRKPSTEPFFFVFPDDFEPLEEALDAVEARLGDVRLAVSNDGRSPEQAVFEDEDGLGGGS